MTDSIMAIAVAVLVPLCLGLLVKWKRAAEECRKLTWHLENKELVIQHKASIIKGAREYIETLHGALKYYACRSNWQSEAGKHSAAYRDKGAIARKALQGES